MLLVTMQTQIANIIQDSWREDRHFFSSFSNISLVIKIMHTYKIYRQEENRNNI